LKKYAGNTVKCGLFNCPVVQPNKGCDVKYQILNDKLIPNDKNQTVNI